jgi:hypothetical protein
VVSTRTAVCQLHAATTLSHRLSPPRLALAPFLFLLQIVQGRLQTHRVLLLSTHTQRAQALHVQAMQGQGGNAGWARTHFTKKYPSFRIPSAQITLMSKQLSLPLVFVHFVHMHSPSPNSSSICLDTLEPCSRSGVACSPRSCATLPTPEPRPAIATCQAHPEVRSRHPVFIHRARTLARDMRCLRLCGMRLDVHR